MEPRKVSQEAFQHKEDMEMKIIENQSDMQGYEIYE